MFTWAAAIIAKLFSGRSSNNFFLLETYSSLVMPGVISPSLSNYNHKKNTSKCTNQRITINNKKSEAWVEQYMWMSSSCWLPNIANILRRIYTAFHYLQSQFMSYYHNINPNSNTLIELLNNASRNFITQMHTYKSKTEQIIKHIATHQNKSFPNKNSIFQTLPHKN